MNLVATGHVRRMKGGAQSQLMFASDGNFYVVKFQNNPQGRHILANEMFAANLCVLLGLPVPQAVVIATPESLIARHPEMRIEFQSASEQCSSGRQFGSRWVASSGGAQVLDLLPSLFLPRVRNLETFAGMLAFDQWTCNCDQRQVIFSKRRTDERYKVSYIDQGFCFNGSNMNFPDSPCHGVYWQRKVYDGIIGWESFEPWLSRITSLSEQEIWACAEQIPSEWYGERPLLERLTQQLIKRRGMVADLITQSRRGIAGLFPNWVDGPVNTIMRSVECERVKKASV